MTKPKKCVLACVVSDKPINTSARLRTSYSQVAGWAHEYSYNPDGIITAEDYSENCTFQTFEVEIADEGQVFLTYDFNENLISRVSDTTVTTYEWDAANRLITIEVEEERLRWIRIQCGES
ncbi:hypothetical protein [Puniceicoccus vermicola]|uniref:RHS repeat protein n=1 Tax=Puniceicoccus vermicola TaxID=388746 RepID=A0A7X1E6H4_9BACT|nr:hypothetical protein [Puniceicoccus vermicola]MBC2604098.1 hypothetical protein [Puniceicoccus vermicola]